LLYTLELVASIVTLE